MSDDTPAPWTMDKKVFAPIPPINKSSSSSDVSTNKGPHKQDAIGSSFGRGSSSRRRPDSAFSSSRSNSASNNGSVRGKNSPQKVKGMDKRSRGGRGAYSGESLNNANDKRDGPEVGSVQAPGAKKRDWDNLFYFAPRERPSASTCVWKSHHAQGRHDSGGGVKREKFSKENFLRANCQFLVKAGNDYAPYLADPDLLVDWDFVEQIVVTMIGERASCPICLGAPIAAKITRCGHIFCWACILHYLALSDNVSRPCPICYESICNKDLKSVVAHVHFDIEIGDVIDMELLRRHKDMLSVAPLHSHEATEEWHELYSKVLLISPADVMDKVIDREHRELTLQMELDPSCPEVCFVHQAIGDLGERKNFLMTVDNSNAKQDQPNNKFGEMHLSKDSPTEERDEYFYFYQDSKGLNIFLHPLNFSMLLKEFGAEMTNWPRYLTFRVIDKEHNSACEETRKRWKFLRHLPLSTPFIIVEVDIIEFISPDVMTEFAPQIEYRKTRREQRAKEEKKMEKIIAERERKLWKIPIIPNFEPRLDFPEFHIHESHTLPDLTAALGTSPSDDGLSIAASEITGGSLTSFAQIASRAPALIKKSPSFPVGSSTAWGKPSASGIPSQRSIGQRPHSDSEPEGDDYVAVPEYRTSVSDAISRALENIVLEEPSAGQRKKKKNKGKVLFATGGMGSFN